VGARGRVVARYDGAVMRGGMTTAQLDKRGHRCGSARALVTPIALCSGARTHAHARAASASSARTTTIDAPLGGRVAHVACTFRLTCAAPSTYPYTTMAPPACACPPKNTAATAHGAHITPPRPAVEPPARNPPPSTSTTAHAPTCPRHDIDRVPDTDNARGLVPDDRAPACKLALRPACTHPSIGHIRRRSIEHAEHAPHIPIRNIHAARHAQRPVATALTTPPHPRPPRHTHCANARILPSRTHAPTQTHRATRAHSSLPRPRRATVAAHRADTATAQRPASQCTHKASRQASTPPLGNAQCRSVPHAYTMRVRPSPPARPPTPTATRPLHPRANDASAPQPNVTNRAMYVSPHDRRDGRASQ